MRGKIKHMFPPVLISAILTFFALPALSQAGFIAIETTTTASATGKTAVIKVSVTNKGDEAAHNVGISAAFASEHFKGTTRDTLPPGEPYSEEFHSTSGFAEQGRYPVIVSVSYTDANLYPFSSLSVSYLNYGDPVECTATGAIPELGIADTGGLNVAVKNIGRDTKNISYELEAPMELAIAVPKGEITVGPQSEKTLETRINNLSALPGSKYRVFAVLQYQDGKGHCSTIIPGDVVIGDKAPLKRFRGYLIGLAALLTGVIAFHNIRRYLHRERKG